MLFTTASSFHPHLWQYLEWNSSGELESQTIPKKTFRILKAQSSASKHYVRISH